MFVGTLSRMASIERANALRKAAQRDLKMMGKLLGPQGRPHWNHG